MIDPPAWVRAVHLPPSAVAELYATLVGRGLLTDDDSEGRAPPRLGGDAAWLEVHADGREMRTSTRLLCAEAAAALTRRVRDEMEAARLDYARRRWPDDSDASEPGPRWPGVGPALVRGTGVALARIARRLLGGSR